jgi:NAD(P)-dependent dehydrogenase (short-subunit alcohol dehydrogenase family)
MNSSQYVRPLSAESAGTAPGRGRLRGRRILVVGGGQQVFDAATDPVGNGRAISLLCAREGAKVAVADRNLTSASETVSMLEREGGSGCVIQADISVEADIARMIDEARTALGGLDGMVLNVGIGAGKLGIENTDIAEWDQVLAVNLRGPMLCCRDGLRHLDNGSSVVFISSLAALKAATRCVAYDASKAALAALMRNVAMEGAPRGIRSNIVAPGYVDTPLGRAASAGRPARAATVLPFGRQATAWEVAYAALFFLSDEGVYVNAQTLVVDCGMTGI